MKFEEALKAMREGKEITRPVFISDDDTVVMGMDVTGENHLLLRNRLYLYHTSDSAKLKRDAIMDSDSVLADDWEIYEEDERRLNKMEFEFEIVPSIEKQVVTSSNLNSYTLKHSCINSGTAEAPVYMITVCTLAKDGTVDKRFTIGQAVTDGVCTYTANTRTLTFDDGDLVAGDNLYVQYEYIRRNGMDFEEVRKALFEGKKVRCTFWTEGTYIYFDDKNMVVRDNNDDIQTYGIYKFLKDREWELYEEKPKPDIIIKAKGCFLPTAEIKSVTISGNEIKGVKQIIPGFDNKTIGLYFDTDRTEVKWENPDESEMSPITRLAREMAKFANIKE